MNEPHVKNYTEYVLPSSVVSKIDVARMVNELERVDNELTALLIRAKAGSQDHTMPVLSEQLTSFLNLNVIQLGTSGQRSEVIKQLRLLKDHVPVIHMTFAVTADHQSLQQLAQWVRSEVHPQAVISVGLQPALIAGVYLRTPNRVRDLSMRSMLDGQHEMLVQKLEAYRGGN